MIIKIIIQGGVVQEVETSEPAVVQIVDLDVEAMSTFESLAQPVRLDPNPEAPDLTAPPDPAL